MPVYPRSITELYVSPLGSDANLGDDPSRPLETIAEAICRGQYNGETVIYLQRGVSHSGSNMDINNGHSVTIDVYGAGAGFDTTITSPRFDVYGSSTLEVVHPLVYNFFNGVQMRIQYDSHARFNGMNIVSSGSGNFPSTVSGLMFVEDNSSVEIIAANPDGLNLGNNIWSFTDIGAHTHRPISISRSSSVKLTGTVGAYGPIGFEIEHTGTWQGIFFRASDNCSLSMTGGPFIFNLGDGVSPFTNNIWINAVKESSVHIGDFSPGVIPATGLSVDGFGNPTGDGILLDDASAGIFEDLSLVNNLDIALRVDGAGVAMYDNAPTLNTFNTLGSIFTYVRREGY